MYPSMLREAAKRQSPAVYVVEVNGFLYTEAERDELGKAATREWLDTLPLSHNKVQAIGECVQGKRLSYYAPLLKYHDNWRKPDLIRNSLSLQQQARDAGYSYTKPFLSISMFLTETDEIPRAPAIARRFQRAEPAHLLRDSQGTGNQKRALCPLPAPHRH